MPALNLVQIIGNLGRDPETRFTPTGKTVTTFSVAVTEHWRNSEGEPQERTEWFNIETWGRLGEICKEYLQKGSLVYIEGRLQTDVVGEGDERKYFKKIVARQMQMLDRRTDTSESESDVLDDDEYPF